jgi:hypothetical protein
MPRTPLKTTFRCFCGATLQGQQAKNEHMLKEHGLKYGYQNVGKTGNKKSGWKKRSQAKKESLNLGGQRNDYRR